MEHVEIRDLGIHGEGIGSLAGLTLFVPGMLPGEEGEVRVLERKKNYATAELLRLSKKAEGRRDPICPHFSKCGGCQLMHLSYDAQVALKTRRVADSLDRIGKIKGYKLFPCQKAPSNLYYRNKIQLPVEGNKVGLYARASHELVEVDKCYIHNHQGEEVYGFIRSLLLKFPNAHLRHLWIRTSIHKKEVLVALVTREKATPHLRKLGEKIFSHPLVVGVMHGRNDRTDNVLRPNSLTSLFGRDFLEETMLGVEVEIAMESFFQVNTLQAEALYQKAFSLAGIKRGTRVLDAYCGAGLFATFLAKEGAFVTGIEVVSEAIKSAKRNAEKNGVEAEFLLGKVEEVIPTLPRYDIIFLNPPRKGCEKIVIDTIANSPPEKIIYTSCDPATLARDLSLFQERGFQVQEVHPFDLFPETMHVETIALLVKNRM